MRTGVCSSAKDGPARVGAQSRQVVGVAARANLRGVSPAERLAHVRRGYPRFMTATNATPFAPSVICQPLNSSAPVDGVGTRVF
jgi:hypothetical protein